VYIFRRSKNPRKDQDEPDMPDAGSGINSD
jgi:hypothetical protein